MESKFKPGIRVRGKPNTEDEGKTGTIIDEISYIGYNSKPAKPTKGSPKWRVLWDGEREPELMSEDYLEIIL